jgi:hypothetical protein
MKFFELAIGDKFKYEDIIYIKVKEERISCCKVGKNAIIYGDDSSSVVIKPLSDVEKIIPPPEQEPPSGHIAPAKTE